MRKSRPMLKILNAGCGNETYGTHFLDAYPTRHEVIKYDADTDKIPFADDYFDVVYSRTLFEHLTNPLFALKEMKRVLKIGGKIILITDNAHHWMFAVNRHIHKRAFGELDMHYFLVNEHHLKNWFGKAGLEVVSVEFVEDDYRCSSPIFKPIKQIINMILPKNISSVGIKITGEKKKIEKHPWDDVDERMNIE